MNGKKITILFGTLQKPLSIGSRAVIRVNGRTMITSAVVAISLVSTQQISFETMNTNYALMAPASEAAVLLPSMADAAA